MIILQFLIAVIPSLVWLYLLNSKDNWSSMSSFDFLAASHDFEIKLPETEALYNSHAQCDALFSLQSAVTT